MDQRFSGEQSLLRSIRRDIAVASRLSRVAQRSDSHLLLPTVGQGNIGDQAMLEAFLRNTILPVTLLVQYPDAHYIPADLRSRVRKVVLSDLFATRPWVRRRIRATVASLIASHSTFSIVGADVMDGAYDSAESTIRFGMLCMSNELRIPNRVLGFSWNGAPPESVLFALNASQPQTLLCLRDPHSLARLSETGQRNLRQTADMVFTATEVEPYPSIGSWMHQQSERPIVIVNASGILARKGVSTTEYVAVCRHLLARNCSLIILPHVIRAGDDDLAACADLFAKLETSDHAILVDQLLSPRQVAWLGRQVNAALTGRMHLSILLLNQRVPAAILSTQGKISGLLELLEVPELMLVPEGSFSAAAITAIDRILDDPSVRGRVEKNLPTLRELASLNFLGLEPVLDHG